jgi:hypothetical protein
MASCQSNETRQLVRSATPSEPIHDVTTTRLDKLSDGVKSDMGYGFGWVKGNGVFTTKPVADTTGEPGDEVQPDIYVGGESRSDGYVREDTVYCGSDFIDPVFTAAGESITTDITNADSIGAKTVQIYTGNDGQELTTEDIYKYLMVETTSPTPHYESTSSVKGVRYEDGTTANTRIVWIQVQVEQQVIGTTAGTNLTQAYEVGYVQTKQPAVVNPDPVEVRVKDFQLFRTYRKRDQHSICEGFLSFGVYNTVTGELVEEITTDQFSMQLGKTGHFGSPTNGYIVGEARLIGSAPTAVTEVELSDNEEALAATHKVGNFTAAVSCTAQDYYVHFPVRGRDDSEGGMSAGGQNLFFHATLTYTHPETGWTKTWSFTHKTDVNVIGWETRTPQVDRSKETVNDVDGTRNLKYEKTFVVQFVNHLYLDGEEIVQVEGDDDFYYPVSKTSGTTKPFHTSEMAIDCWTSYLP